MISFFFHVCSGDPIIPNRWISGYVDVKKKEAEDAKKIFVGGVVIKLNGNGIRGVWVKVTG